MFIEQRQREWAELQNQGLVLLENPDQIAPRDLVREMNPLLRVWVFPTADAFVSWTIYKSRPNANHDHTLLRRAIWDRVEDSRRLRESGGRHQHIVFEPTLSVTDRLLKPEQIANLHLDRKFSIGVSVSREVIGLDDTTSGVQTFSFLGGLRATWWQGGPTDWRDLITWATDIRTHLIEYLNEPPDKD